MFTRGVVWRARVGAARAAFWSCLAMLESSEWPCGQPFCTLSTDPVFWVERRGPVQETPFSQKRLLTAE